MQQRTWWMASIAVSIVLVIVLVALWVHVHRYEVEPTQLVNHQAVEDYLGSHAVSRMADEDGGVQPPLMIRTGLFIQSLEFFNSSEVNLSGYIWQHYVDGLHDAIRPGPSEAGLVLPEQVNSGSDIEPREVYRIRHGNEEVIGWYFEATLRQLFDYSRYPFDHKTVWVRLWPRDFSRNIILVPDFDAYAATGVEDLFGIDKRIVLGAWEWEDTYFDYQLSDYDTNFGIHDYIGQKGFPELHFNFVIKRKFGNAFIVYLLPLLLVASLLFAAMLTISDKDKLSDRLGFNVSGFIGACSALFFVILLSHIQLREQFAGTSIVYIEYFYIMMYVMLVAATVNTYLFATRSGILGNVILYEDNIIPKITFWPVVLGSMILLTLAVM
ncbi:MAG: hypothetical protein P8Z31_12020 [Gammaproteobacteria bacterium]